MLSNFWKNWRRVTRPDNNQDVIIEELKSGYNRYAESPIPHAYTQMGAEAVIQLPYATVSIAPNFDIHNPKIVLTVSEIFDARDRKVNVTRIELTSKEAGRLSRAMSSAADWANGCEER